MLDKLFGVEAPSRIKGFSCGALSIKYRIYGSNASGVPNVSNSNDWVYRTMTDCWVQPVDFASIFTIANHIPRPIIGRAMKMNQWPTGSRGRVVGVLTS